MRTALAALSFLAVCTCVQAQQYRLAPQVYLARGWYSYQYERLIHRDRQHPSTINGVVLGNLLPEGPIYPPKSVWSDVQELKMLPPTASPGYSYATSGVDDASDMVGGAGSTTTDSGVAY